MFQAAKQVKTNQKNQNNRNHTADGPRIPILGQKILETVSEDDSTQLSKNAPNCGHLMTLDSSRAVCGCLDLVVFGRKGGY